MNILGGIVNAMGNEVGSRIRCGECGKLLVERSDLQPEERPPCPLCGSRARRFEIELCSRLHIRSGLRTRARHETGRWFVDQFAGSEYSVGRGRWMDKLRRIDREADWYEEVVTDPETGKILHETHEPLSRHRGHGSARHRGPLKP